MILSSSDKYFMFDRGTISKSSFTQLHWISIYLLFDWNIIYPAAEREKENWWKENHFSTIIILIFTIFTFNFPTLNHL